MIFLSVDIVLIDIPKIKRTADKLVFSIRKEGDGAPAGLDLGYCQATDEEAW